MKRTRWIAALAVSAVALPVSIWSLRAQQAELVAQAPAALAEHEGPLGVAEGVAEVPGQLFDLDGKTPLAGYRILFKDAHTGKVLARAVSDGEGKFAAPKLEPGSYVMVVEAATYRLKVDLEQAPTSLKVVVAGARDAVPLADLRPIEGDGGELDTTTLGLGIGGGAAVIGAGVGLGVLAADGDDSVKVNAFSPSTP